jgi:hypothetical protein
LGGADWDATAVIGPASLPDRSTRALVYSADQAIHRAMAYSSDQVTGPTPLTPPLILAEIEVFGWLTPQRIVEQFAAAFGAQVEPHPLVDIVAEFFVLRIVNLFEDLLDFLQVISIIVGVLLVDCVQRRVNFHFDNIAQIVLRFEYTTAAITRIVDHRIVPCATGT